MTKAHEGKAQAEKDLASAECTSDWYLDESTGAWSRRNHTSIRPLICGAEAFSAIEDAIRNAELSIEIATWGFDPSLRLRGSAVTMQENCATIQTRPGSRKSCMPYTGGDLEANPRIGDLLLWAAANNRQVRVLVWRDVLARLARVDENLPESGLDGNGIHPPVHRTLWRERLNDGKGRTNNDKPADLSDEELSRLLRAEVDRRLLANGEVLEAYKSQYAKAFGNLITARDKEKEGDWIEGGLKYNAIKTLSEINAGFLAAYWQGYTKPLLNLVNIDSPGTQVDDHYYNAEWFRMVRSDERVTQTGESPESVPDFVKNIKVKYRGQDRDVDGGTSPAMQRINRVAKRLEFLAPKLQQNKEFQDVSKFMERFLLWWKEDEILRPSSTSWHADQKKAFASALLYLKTNDYTNLYGVRDYINEVTSDFLQVPLVIIGDAIKSINKVQKLMDLMQLFSAQAIRTLAATYHQKTVLIDYKSDKGKAVGFVMGHNMLKNYMDDAEHKMFGSAVRYPEFGPWQDISVKVRGECLKDIANNFAESWPGGSSGDLHESNLLAEDGNGKIAGLGQVLRTALCPGGSPPGHPEVSLESINEDVAAELEEICNLFEKILGATITDFKKLTEEAKKQFPHTAGELDMLAADAGRKIDEATADARAAAEKSIGEAQSKTADALGKIQETVNPVLTKAQNTLDTIAPVNTGASPAVRGPDATSIYDSYLNAIHNCSIFLYMENQYFRHELLAEEAKKTALRHVAAGGGPLYWFVITNHPASDGEAPNTAKMLEELGQHERLAKYVRDPHDKKMLRKEYQKGVKRRDEIDKELAALQDPGWHTTVWDDAKIRLRIETKDEQAQAMATKRAELEAEKNQLSEKLRDIQRKYPNIGTYGEAPKTYLDEEERKKVFNTTDVTVQDVEKDEEKLIKLKEEQGIDRNDPCLKVHVATITSCSVGTPCMYTPIYVHSKLLIVDDAYMSIGSANINFRSMHVDAEINIATDSGNTAAELRKKLFVQHTLKNQPNAKKNFLFWQSLMDKNWRFMHKGVELEGFLTHFYDPVTPVAKPTD